MPRTVKVNLDMGGDAKGELDGLEIKITLVNEKVKETDEHLKKIPPDAAKAAAAMKLLGDSIKDVGDGKVKTTSMDVIDRRIAGTRAEVRRLADEFNKSGDSSLFQKLGTATKDLEGLERIRKQLTSALKVGAEDGAAQGGSMFTKIFGSTLQGFFSTPVLGPFTVAAIAAITAALLPAINGALLAVGGMGGLALGIVGQLSDPQIKTAFSHLGDDLMDSLADATASFKQPMLDALTQIGAVLKGVMEGIDFDSLSKDLGPVVTAFGNLISYAMPGFNKLLAAAEPILQDLPADFEVLGKAISTMFEEMSAGGQGALEGFRALIALIAGTLVTIGAIIFVASKGFEYFVTAIDDASGAVEWFFKKIEGAARNPVIAAVIYLIEKYAEATNKAASAIRDGNKDNMTATWVDRVGQSAEEAKKQLDALATTLNTKVETSSTIAAAAVKKLFDQMMTIDMATQAFDKSLITLGDTLVANGGHLSAHVTALKKTETGLMQNKDALLAAITANMQLYQAQVASGISASDAAAQYDKNTGAIQDQIKAGGKNTKELQAMIDKYRNVPDTINTAINLYGLTQAINNLGTLIAQVNGLDGRSFGFSMTETTTEIINHINQDNGHVQRWGGIYQHADTGLLNAGIYSATSPARYAFAEPATGGEGFVPRYGDYARSTAIIDQEARWYGGRFTPNGMAGTSGGMNVTTFNLNVIAGMGTNGAEVGQQIADRLRPYVVALGGNVQYVLGRRGR